MSLRVTSVLCPNNNSNNNTIYATDTHSNGAVLLMTDGVPNIIPPRGHVATLQKYISKHPNPRRAIHTFGFGYQLQSDLLCDIADIGNGAYAFIPDGGLVGTVFVHAASNLLAAQSSSATCTIEAKDGAKIKSVVGFPEATEDGPCARVTVNMGPLLYGQAKSLVVVVEKEEKTKVTDVVSMHINTATGKLTGDWRAPCKEGSFALEAIMRAMAVSGILEAVSVGKAKGGEIDVAAAKKVVESMIDEGKKLVGEGGSSSSKSKFLQALLEDLEGQVATAVSKEEYFKKWGVHYLPSLARAHRLQITNNFKDPGVQGYAGKTFDRVRDVCDDLFLSLPPPTPLHIKEFAKITGQQPAQSNVQMSSYYSAAAPCFSGGSKVKLKGGGWKAVRDVRAGDWVVSSSSSSSPSSSRVTHAKIQCVVKTLINDGSSCSMVCFPKGLMITPYHPVLSDSCRPHARYQFPIDLVGSDRHDEGGGGAEAKERPPRLIVASNCKSVYSFLLEEQGNDEERGVSAPSSSIVINDRQCLALGHEIWRDPVARHEFFGSRRKVVGNLSSMKGWAQGYVVLESGRCCVRDPITNHVVALRQ